MVQHDIIILGAGLGGLLCGVILAKEGYNVGIIEQNRQIGGCLQSFSFGKKLFDSCIHYIGSVSEGKNQYKIFKYAEILDQLDLMPYERDCYDAILTGDDPVMYPLAQGYDNYVAQLAKYFPHQREALENYVALIRDVLQKFPLYMLKNGDPTEKLDVLNWTLKEVIDDLFSDEKLKEIVVGNSILYAGNSDTTPFYIHALVCSSYIEGAYKVRGSSARIAKALWKSLQKYGGTIYRNEKVTLIREREDASIEVQTHTGKHYIGGKCISNIHPKQTLSLLESNKIKKAFRQRIEEAPNSVSILMVNIVLRPRTIPHRKYNIYWNEGNAMEVLQRLDPESPDHYAIYFTEDNRAPGFAETISLLSYMDVKELAPYSHTFNNTGVPVVRNHEYEAYKNKIAQLLIDKVAVRFPEIKEACLKFKVATPLTFRDYMGTDDGSVYGIIADARSPLSSQISVQTKVPNLFLTGQNINVHGVLGVSITAVSTCAHILGLDYLLSKLNQEDA